MITRKRIFVKRDFMLSSVHVQRKLNATEVHETVRSEFENLGSIYRQRKLRSFTTGTICDIPFPPGIKIMLSEGNRIAQDGRGS
jgi:hypothetical protein